MTPPEHLLIGISIGNIFYSLQSVIRKKYLSYFLIIIMSGIFAVCPDVDSFFGHYSSVDVYIGHRGVTHSLLFVFILSASAVLFILLIKKIRKYVFSDNSSCNAGIFITFVFSLLFFSGVSHLIADLPQPPGIWGGIPLFFPYKNNDIFFRVGGWSKIGWYDYKIYWSLFCVVFISFLISLIIYIFNRIFRTRIVIILAIILMLMNVSVNVWLACYVGNSRYINSTQWNKLQNDYLRKSNTLIKKVTIHGKEYFMKLFRTIK